MVTAFFVVVARLAVCALVCCVIIFKNMPGKSRSPAVTRNDSTAHKGGQETPNISQVNKGSYDG